MSVTATSSAPSGARGRVAGPESGRQSVRALPLDPGGGDLASKSSAIWGISAKLKNYVASNLLKISDVRSNIAPRTACTIGSKT